MLNWMVENTAVAGLLAVVALGATYFYRSRPALCHVLWVIVLIRLVLPPIAIPGWPPRELKSALQSAIDFAMPPTESGPVSLPPSVSPGPASAAIEADREKESMLAGALDGEKIEASRRDPWGWESAQIGAAYSAQFAREEGEKPKEEPVAMAEAGEGSVERGTSTAFIWCMAIWGVGSIGLSGIWLCRTLRFRKAVSRASAPPRGLEVAVGEAARELGVRAPRIAMHGPTGSPSLWCVGKPLLLWPESMADAPEETLRPVIAHELSHLRRRDHWTAWLEMAATIFVWWHPLVWIARRQLRRQAELACDARVVAAMPGKRRHYAESLITAAAGPLFRQPPAALAAVDSDRRSFEQRVRLIMQGRMSDHLSLASVVALVAVTLVVAPTWAGSVGSWWFAPTAIESSLRAAATAEITSVRADRYYQSRSWQASAGAYAQVVAYDPTSGISQKRLGDSLLAAGRPDEAIDAFDTQIQIGYQTAEAYFQRARALASMDRSDEAAETLIDAVLHGFVDADRVRRDTVLAELILQSDDAETAAKEMADARGFQAEADEALAHSDWSQAYAKLRAAAYLSPMDGALQSRLADAAERTNALDKAEAALLAQVELRYEPAQAMFNVARVRSHQGRIDEAIEALDDAVASGFRDLQRMESDAWLTQARACDDYAAIARRVGEPERLRLLVQQAIESKSYETAVAAADRLLAFCDGLSDHQRGIAHHQKGMALLGLGRADEAAQEFVKQVELRFWVTEGLYRIACCRSSQGRSAEALLYLNAAVEAGMFGDERLRDEPMLANIGASAQFDRVLNLANDNRTLLGMFKAADWEHLKELNTHAISQDPNNGPAHLRLGWALLRLGEYEAAVDVFKAQNHIGHLPLIAQYNVACAYALMNDRTTAIKWLEAARINGWSDFQFALRDPDLANLRNDPAFQRLCASSTE
jgi:beta-lactamase regulating signal transducer with metallopeptidase domain/Flp pilus assembly protein TadD